MSVVCVSGFERILGFKIIRGYMKCQDFCLFMAEFIENHFENGILSNEVYFVLDNATIHKTVAFDNVRKNLNFYFLPSYSTHLNFIEIIFSGWKNLIRKANSNH